jgi:acetylserotonin N-methyltransferase
MTAPDPAPILDLLDGFRRSKTMFAAVALGVFDDLADGPRSYSDLARAVGAHPDSLLRLLEACLSIGLLRREGDLFFNTALASTYLTGRSPHSLAGYVRYSDRVLYPMWAQLDDAVHDNSNRWEQTFNLPPGTIFDQFFHTEDAMQTFLKGMHGFGMLTSPAIVRAFDLSRFRVFADIGGGTGHFAEAACATYPEMRAIVFDLPRVISFTRDSLAKSPHASRIECRSGDFFRDPLPEADLYGLSRILHDWPEKTIETLLQKIYATLPAGGGVLIAEKLFDNDHSGPAHVHMQSLNMLVCTEGRERSREEYRVLLERNGFTVANSLPDRPPVDAILAIRNS